MRLLAVCLAILVALPTTVRAEETEDGDFVAMPKRSIGVMLLAHGSRLGGRSESGFGGALDLALGRGRWQYFIEGGVASSSASTWTTSAVEMRVDGRMLHAGGGMRWLARQFRDQNKTAGFEMYLLSLLGVQRFYLDDGTRLTRPALGLGVGLHGRLYKRPGIGIRLDMRLLFTPDDDQSTCRGRCMGEAGANTGFMGGVGFTW